MEELKDINAKIKEQHEKIEKLVPPDTIEHYTGAKVGTEEYNEQAKLIDTVKTTNSTRRVNRTLFVFKMFGYLALLMAVIFKFIGIIYDINFHLPFLAKATNSTVIAIMGVFTTAIILISTHVAGDAIVNNKWKKIPRFILIWLMAFGLAASIYFDYRAINNYTNTLVVNIKKDILKDENNINAIKISADDKEISILNRRIEQTSIKLNNIDKRLEEIGGERAKINNSIEEIKDKKTKSNLSNKEIRKLNQNIYTSRKQLDALAQEEENLIKREDKIKEELKELRRQKKEITDTKITQISELDNKMSDEQFNRFVFLIVFILVVELTSYGGLLADFLGNKNLTHELKGKIEQLRNDSDMSAVVLNHLNIAQAQQAQDINKQLEMLNAVNRMHSLSNINLMYQQGENIKDMVKSTSNITRSTRELTELATKGIINDVALRLEREKNKKILEFLNGQPR